MLTGCYFLLIIIISPLIVCKDEATLSSLNRAIRETLQQVEKSEQEIALLRAKVDGLRAQLVIARTQRDALVGQLQACNKELDKLRAESVSYFDLQLFHNKN